MPKVKIIPNHLEKPFRQDWSPEPQQKPPSDESRNRLNAHGIAIAAQTSTLHLTSDAAEAPGKTPRSKPFETLENEAIFCIP